jgi:hypothetical protein
VWWQVSSPGSGVRLFLTGKVTCRAKYLRLPAIYYGTGPFWVKQIKPTRKRISGHWDKGESLSFGRNMSSLHVTGKQLTLSSGEKWPFKKNWR